MRLNSFGAIDWRRALPRLVVLVVLLVIVVVGALWATGVIFQHEDKQAARPQKAPAIARESGQSKSGQNKESSPGATNSSTPSTAPAPSTSSGQATNANTSSGQLTNTGPGETAALFGAAAAGGTVLYQVRLRKRLD